MNYPLPPVKTSTFSEKKMMAATQQAQERINNQFQFAKKKYPGLTQKSSLCFEIAIPGQKTPYRITLPQDYPVKGPQLSQGSTPVNVILCDNWNPLFQLVHVCQQLTVRGSAKPVAPQKLDTAELNSAIQKAKPDDLITSAGRRTIIEQLPCYQRARQLAVDAEARIQNADNTINSLLLESATDAESLKALDEERKTLDGKLKSINSQGPARMALALRQKSEDLQKKCDKLNIEIGKLDAAQGDEYAKRYFELKQKQNLAKLLSDHFLGRAIQLQNR
jgi:hypothetical protein